MNSTNIDLLRIVEYVVAEEVKDYYNREKDDRTDHIYTSILRLADAMGGQVKELVDAYDNNYKDDCEDEEDEIQSVGECGRCGEDNGKGGTVLWCDLCDACDRHEMPTPAKEEVSAR